MSILENLTNELINFIISVLDLFPDDPFLKVAELEAPATVVMGYVNWFIDFPFILSLISTWCAAILGWYVYSIILRWVKLAG